MSAGEWQFKFWLVVAGIAVLAYFVALSVYRKSRTANHILSRVIPALLGAFLITFLLAFAGKWLLSLFYQ